MRIETERLIITEFTPDMARAVHENSLDGDNRRFVPDEVFETVEEAGEAIAFLMSQYGRFEGPLAYPVLTKAGGENIGYVQLVPIGDGRWEIGYHIAKKHTGNGYATEAVSAFLPVMAEAVGIHEVHGICLSENVASKRVLAKCGFISVFEGTGDYQGEKREVFRSIRKFCTQRMIRTMEEKYLQPSLELVEDVFTRWDSPEEGKTVRALVEEIRAKKYYLPELELIMTDGQDQINGYAMFSRFHLEGRYEDELLILTPVAVRTEFQRQHISRDLIEYGLEKAKALGYKAVLVEGNPRNYNPRGFVTSADHGIVAGPAVHLPHVSCLMVRELEPGALEHIRGTVDYSFYNALHEG